MIYSDMDILSFSRFGFRFFMQLQVYIISIQNSVVCCGIWINSVSNVELIVRGAAEYNLLHYKCHIPQQNMLSRNNTIALESRFNCIKTVLRSYALLLRFHDKARES